MVAGGIGVVSDASASSGMDNGAGQQPRTQDDAAVGYVFQRPPDPEFSPYGPKQARWALGDDTIIDVSLFLLYTFKVSLYMTL